MRYSYRQQTKNNNNGSSRSARKNPTIQLTAETKARFIKSNEERAPGKRQARCPARPAVEVEDKTRRW